jgi:hypothetical protein
MVHWPNEPPAPLAIKCIGLGKILFGGPSERRKDFTHPGAGHKSSLSRIRFQGHIGRTNERGSGGP